MISAIETSDEAQIQAAQNRVQDLMAQDEEVRTGVKDLILREAPGSIVEDRDYVFITFITTYLPIGLVGLLLAVIFSAAMSSTASELNALATTTVIDIYRRSLVKDKSDRHYLQASKFFTILWGGIALVFAASASLFENLIQAVNIIGSLFYGAILGVFLVAFFMKWVKSRAVFIGAILGEVIVLMLFTMNATGFEFELFGVLIQVKIAYLWLNLIGCALVMAISAILQGLMRNGE